MNARYAMNAYSNTQVHSGIMDASPHKLTAMLLSGAMDRLNVARGAVETGDAAKRGEMLGKAISIPAPRPTWIRSRAARLPTTWKPCTTT